MDLERMAERYAAITLLLVCLSPSETPLDREPNVKLTLGT